MNMMGIRAQNKKVFSLLFSLLILSGAFSPLFALEITVKQSAIVKGDTVRLGDIAQFDPLDDSRVSGLKTIEITASPVPGSDATINKDLLIYRINPYISGDKDILIRVPETLALKRSAQTVSADRMKEIFIDYVKGNAPWSEAEMTIEDIYAPADVALPEGKLTWKVQDKGNADFIGNVSITVDFSVDSRLVKKVPVAGKVSIMTETIKAARKIDRGQVITADDLVTVMENTRNLRKEALTDMKDIIGKRSKRTIQSDQMILANMIENPPMVKKGDKVIIRAENSDMRITAAGEALQDGAPGEMVEVLNTQSGRKVFATVKGSGVVDVTF